MCCLSENLAVRMLMTVMSRKWVINGKLNIDCSQNLSLVCKAWVKWASGTIGIALIARFIGLGQQCLVRLNLARDRRLSTILHYCSAPVKPLQTTPSGCKLSTSFKGHEFYF